MIKLRYLLLLIFSMAGAESVFADVDKVEVYFLSRPKVSHFNHLIEKYINPNTTYKKVVEYKCIPMGEGCFHPQLGMIPLEEAKSEKVQKGEPKPIEHYKTFNSDDVDLVECEDGNYFDIFCGKEKKGKKKRPVNDVDYQLWIDTSSSMREIDYSKEADYCERRFLASQIQNKCGEKMQIFTFDTAIKSLGGIESVCMSYGMNDGKRMVDWIKRSNAKHITIITDVDEYTGEFREYLNLIGAKIHGIGTKMVYASEMPKILPTIQKYCQ